MTSLRTTADAARRRIDRQIGAIRLAAGGAVVTSTSPVMDEQVPKRPVEA